MRKSRFNESQRQAILDSYLKGNKTVEALCEEHQISPENQPKIACPVPKVGRIVERLNGTVRKECLNLNWFHSLDEVNDLLGHWYKSYNFDRPHSSLKYKTPVAFENLNQNLYFKMALATGG